MPDLVDFSRQTITQGEKNKKLVFLVSGSPNAGADSNAVEGDASAIVPDEEISISNYDLSSIVTCSRICYALEEIWGVL